VLGLDVDLDAHLVPVAFDELESVDPEVLQRRAGYLDGEAHALPVGSEPKALTVAFGEPGSVQVLVGLVEIELGVLLAEALVKELRLPSGCRLPRLTLALENCVDELFAVDRVGQADAKVFVAEYLA